MKSRLKPRRQKQGHECGNEQFRDELLAGLRWFTIYNISHQIFQTRRVATATFNILNSNTEINETR